MEVEYECPRTIIIVVVQSKYLNFHPVSIGASASPLIPLPLPLPLPWSLCFAIERGNSGFNLAFSRPRMEFQLNRPLQG